MLDFEFSKEYQNPGRSLLCAPCKTEGKKMEIAVDKNIQLEAARCQGIPSHKVDANMKDLFSTPGRHLGRLGDQLTVLSSSRLKDQPGHHDPKRHL